ncbi:MAG TPA: YppG family protein [Neobacillus sp.]
MFAKNEPNYHFNNGYSGQIMHEFPMDFQWNHLINNRNQPFPFQPTPQNFEWNPYPPQGPYYPQQFQPYGQNYQAGFGQQKMPFPNQPYPQKDTQFLFQNPLQPQDDMAPKPYMPMNGYPTMNPYPKQNVLPKQPGGVQSIMNSFKSQDGSVDFNKMMNTAGQMMNAVNQVSSLVKGFGGFFKV